MGYFPIKMTTDTPAFANNFDSIPLNRLNYTHYDGQTLIYCNNPEGISEGSLRDNGRIINKASITTREFLVYVSAKSNCAYDIKLAIRAKNISGSTITVTRINSGFNTSTKWDVATVAYENFFKSIKDPKILTNGKTEMLFEGRIPAQNFVETLIKFETTGNVEIEVFTYKTTISPSAIPSNSDTGKYSGTANAFYISTNNTIKAADLFVSYYNSIFYGIAKRNFSGNSTEHNPIKLVQGGTATEDNPESNYGNLGNWGLQYAFSTTLINDTQNSVKFKGYIISNSKSHCAGIQSGGIAKGIFLGPEGTNTNRRWNFCETSTVNKQSSITLDYQYMHLSKGCAPGIIQWEAIRV